MDQRIIDLYDEYTHAPLPRRIFLERLGALAGSAAAIPAILAAIEPNYARAAIVAEDDGRLAAEHVRYQGATGDVAGYLARPKLAEKAPAVIVVHENRGLNAYVEDVTRRLATEGFVALAPDLLSPAGGTPQDADKARDLIGKLDPDKTVNDLVAAMSYLMAYRYSSAKVGAIGFCWGGGMVNRLAIKAPDLKAGVAFYGPTPDPELVGTIKAPLMLHYAGLDQRLNAGIPAYDEALKKAGVEHQILMYEGVNHAFHNDTSAERYNKEAADLAWKRSVEFLKSKLA
ncbi:dienelactone hydrolase family protein [Azospirillum picis]|uniref:Carboxymethylenebutenolidase n=1 Tax=Azospirillum picis TaxID=488438 RepID=A0ABU0MJF2_9PROT|nr:dienelactone hydrolase family protein [Azospirillum picis]MBP2299532.1 carboxymethylenebutenolidase [Azospirillum picis]MDQ0533341.1 carboxymethylenebutenolidase [Azospirillum picis]